MFSKSFQGLPLDGSNPYLGGVQYVNNNGFLVEKNDTDTKLYVEDGHLKFNNHVITDADSDANAVHFSNEAGTIPDGSNGEKITRIVMTSSDDVTSGHIQMNNGGFEINQPLTTDQDINAGTGTITASNIDATNKTDIAGKVSKSGDSMNGNLTFNTPGSLIMNSRGILHGANANAMTFFNTDKITMQNNNGGSSTIDFYVDTDRNMVMSANDTQILKPLDIQNPANILFDGEGSISYSGADLTLSSLDTGGKISLHATSSIETDTQLITSSTLKCNTGNTNKIFLANNENANRISLANGWISEHKCGDSAGAQSASNGKFSIQTANGTSGHTERVGVDSDNTTVSNNLKLVSNSFQINNTDTISSDGSRLAFKTQDLAFLSDVSEPTATLTTSSLDSDVGNRNACSCMIQGRLYNLTKQTSFNYWLGTLYPKNSVNRAQGVQGSIYDNLANYSMVFTGNQPVYINWCSNGYGIIAYLMSNDTTGNVDRIRIAKMSYNSATGGIQFGSPISLTTTGGADYLGVSLAKSHTTQGRDVDVWYLMTWKDVSGSLRNHIYTITYTNSTGTLAEGPVKEFDYYLSVANIYGTGTRQDMRSAPGENSGVILSYVNASIQMVSYILTPFYTSGSIISNSTGSTNVPLKSLLVLPDIRMSNSGPVYYAPCVDIVDTRGKNKFKEFNIDTYSSNSFILMYAWKQSNNIDTRFAICQVEQIGENNFDINNFSYNTTTDSIGNYISASSPYLKRFIPSSKQNTTNTTFNGCCYCKKQNKILLYCNSPTTGFSFMFVDLDTLEPVEPKTITGATKDSQYPFILNTSNIHGLFAQLHSVDDIIYISSPYDVDMLDLQNAF